MVRSMYRPTRLIIDTQAIKENIRTMKRNTPEEMAVFAVVKADGYGHGAIEVAKIAEQAGVNGFCVATIDEGIELREAGIVLPILILGVIEVHYLPIVSEYQLSIPVATNEWLLAAHDLYQKNPWEQTITIHLALDTGMGRIGFTDAKELHKADERIREYSEFFLEGIFTHFATADEPETIYWQEQYQTFEKMVATLPSIPAYVHLENSATNIWHESIGNLVRYGIAMYGMNPSGKRMALTYPLKPALRLESKLMQVKELPKGSGVGYGRTYETSKSEWIGTVPIGYGDGYIRKLQGFHVIIDGEFCPIVGRICMDQLMVRLPKEIAVGTKVTLIGENKDKCIETQDLADFIGTINYEVTCLFTNRIPRIYV